MLEAKLDGNGVKSESGILPRDEGLAVVALELGAGGDVVEEMRVFGVPIAKVTARLGQVRPEGSFAPSLSARPLHRQPFVPPVQVVDHVVVVIVLVVVNVVVLQKSWPEMQAPQLYKL